MTPSTKKEGPQLSDPITMSVIQHRLESINKEMGYAMLRTSKSPIFAEVHDFSTAICDWKPRLISQVDGVPTHTASSMIATQAITETFGDDIYDGDVFILNDAYTGGTAVFEDLGTKRRRKGTHPERPWCRASGQPGFNCSVLRRHVP